MKEVRWNLLKNERLKKTRGVSFEELIHSELIKVLQHPRKKNQMIMLFKYKKYIWIVPFVEKEDYYFLKTLYPSRKYTKMLKGEDK